MKNEEDKPFCWSKLTNRAITIVIILNLIFLMFLFHDNRTRIRLYKELMSTIVNMPNHLEECPHSSDNPSLYNPLPARTEKTLNSV